MGLEGVGEEDIRGEETGEEVSDNSTYAMFGKDIQCVVYAQDVFQFRGIIASDRAYDPEDDR